MTRPSVRGNRARHETAAPLRPFSEWLPPHRRRPDGPLQLALGAEPGGAFVLRVEDTDQDRSSLDSVKAILDAMKWLGMDWDEGPEVGGPYASYFQSERKPLYRELTEKLIKEGKAYRCYCTKEELDRAREELKARNPQGSVRVPGHLPAPDRRARPPYVVPLQVTA